MTVMETLQPVSVGAGALPTAAGSPDDEVAYMRGCFEHFFGFRDSESLYMVALQGGGTGPELAVLFVRLSTKHRPGPCMQCAQDATHGALLEQ